MPEVDTIAGLTNEGHYPIAKDVLIKIGILVFDDEDCPKGIEYLLACLIVIHQSNTNYAQIDEAIQELFEVKFDIDVTLLTRFSCYLQVDISLLELFASNLP